MRSSYLIFAALAATAGIASCAHAAPKLYYCAATGDLVVENDFPGSVINIKSRLNQLNPPKLPVSIPSGAIDLSDLPSFISLINVPAGTIRMGPGVVDAGVTISDISMDWYGAAGPSRVGEVIARCIPEPASLATAGLAALGFLATVRRRRSELSISVGQAS